MLAKVRIMSSAALAAASFLAGTQVAQTPKDSISLGEVELSVGMAQDAVLSKLGEYFQLVKMTQTGGPRTRWRVLGKNRELIGSVTFVTGKLWAARKSWAYVPDDTGALRVAQALIDVVGNFEKQRNTACTIGTPPTEQQPDFREEEVVMTCGAKEIAVAVGGPPGESSSVWVDESLLPR